MWTRSDDTALTGTRKMVEIVTRLLESVPLGVFLLYLAFARPEIRSAWREPYFVCAGLALLGQAALQVTGLIRHSIYLALALYFICGGTALALDYRPLSDWYGEVEAAAMLVWVAVVGIVTTVARPAGFTGYTAASRRQTVAASLILLLVVLIATAVSFAGLGHPLWNAYAPFVAVFVAHAWLRDRLRRRDRARAALQFPP